MQNPNSKSQRKKSETQITNQENQLLNQVKNKNRLKDFRLGLS